MKLKSSRIISFSVVYIFTLSCFLSCNYSNSNNGSDEGFDFKNVSVDSSFSMSVPSIMKEAKSLNEDAVLQYSNVYKEIYFVVIKEDKENFIDTFMDLNEYDTTLSVVENYRIVQLRSMGERIKIQNQTEPKALKINSLPAQYVRFDGTVEDVKYEIAYFLTFVEGKRDVYMIMCWTLSDRKEKYRTMFEEIAKSLKEK